MSARRTGDAGGLLVEALIALTVVGAITAGVLEGLFAARSAEARTDLRREASWVLRSTAVLARAASPATLDDFTTDLAYLAGPRRVESVNHDAGPVQSAALDALRCHSALGLSRTVGVRAVGDVGSDELLPRVAVSSRAGRHAEVSGSGEARLWLSLVDRAGVPHVGRTIVVEGPSGGTEIATTDHAGCVEISSIDLGIVRARVPGDLIDHRGRSADGSGIAFDLRVADQRLQIVLDESVAVRVVPVAAPGAILPTAVATTLWWGVLGSERFVPTDGVQSLAWWSGPAVAVVSACPGALGEATVQSVVFDGAGSTGVLLPTVRVEGLETVSAPVISARRAASCPGSTSLQPVLRWPGPHASVASISLPGGVWDVSLETTSGALLSGPVTIASGVPDATVRFFG